MSPADSGSEGTPLRLNFTAELEQLRLQVEMMGVLVDHNLERMREVLHGGDTALAAEALRADDDIDAMNVSLTERCYEVLAREGPVASDLRLVVSVIRMTSELERIGDLALRVVKLAPAHDVLASNPRTFDILQTMADEAVDHFRVALRAWSGADLDLATGLAEAPRTMDLHNEQLMQALVGLEGPDAVNVALRTLVAGQALERINDHAAILGARLRYLLTGDPDHLTAEVR